MAVPAPTPFPPYAAVCKYFYAKAYRVHVPEAIDVKAIRTKLAMTQEEFAGRFGFSVNTLRHWEQGLRQPEGPTRAYLLVIDRAPKAVQKALQAA